MENTTVLLQCLISVWMILYAYNVPFARLRRDNFRSNIRRIRDELFLEMAKQKLSFTSRAYLEVRQLLNGMIRGSVYFTPGMYLVALIAKTINRRPVQKLDVIEQTLNLQPGPLQQLLCKSLLEACQEAERFMFWRRITGWVVLVFRGFAKLLLKIVAKQKATPDKPKDGPTRRLLSHAYYLGAESDSLVAVA